MICKKDVLQWFRELESYKRIDTMCSLLIVCLPFELRFLGTCLEELGRRDSLELRGMELRANNPLDLAADMLTCQKGEPTDIKIRRKMALYLALIRACNRTCVSEIFRTLKCWGDRDFTSMTDQDTLLELMLVYTMAANHPVFSFQQQMKCTEILDKIKENKLVADEQPTSNQAQQHQQQQQPQQPQQQQQQQLHHHQSQHTTHPPTQQQQQELLLQQQQHTQHALHQLQTHGVGPPQNPQGPPQQHPQIIQMLPQGTIPISIFPQHLQKLLPGSDGTHQISVDSIPHMIPSNITIPTDTNAILGHQSTAPTGWTMRHYAPMQTQPQPMMEQHQLPVQAQASSPMLSQQSSPSSSRTTSPNRVGNVGPMQQQQQQLRSLPQRLAQSGKSMRRPSAETTPPPMGSGELIMVSQHVKHMEESINEGGGGGNISGTITSLPSLIRNGYPRAVHHQRIKTGAYIPPHQQQHQHQQQQQQQQQQQLQSPVGQQPQHFQTTGYINQGGLVYTMHNMNINDDSGGGGGGGGGGHSSTSGVSSSMMSINSNKSAGTTGSESGSSNGSSGEISPPETPTPLHTVTPVSANMITSVVTTSGGLIGAGGGGGGHIGGGGYKHHLSFKQAQQLNLQQRLNGRNGVEKSYQQLYAANSPNEPPTNQQSSNPSHQQPLLTSPSPVSTPTTTVLLQQQQQQPPTSHTPYNTATYPYHATNARVPPQPLLQAHNAPPPQAVHGGFRFPLAPPHNGELIYPAAAYHAGLTFLPVPTAAAPQPTGTHTTVTAPPPQLRSTSTNAAVQTQTPPTPQQQQVVAPPQMLAAATVAATPYSALTVCPITGAGSGAPSKNISCYNCGSQTHSGRDCQEASMEDVTRNASYKLDYTATTVGSAAAAAAATTNASGDGTKDGSTSSSSSSSLLINAAATTSGAPQTPQTAAASASVTSSGK